MADWFVYVVRCRDGTLYTGISRDVEARVAKHNQGKGARYTRGRGPVALIHRERKSSQAAALRREAAIKALSRPEKLALVKAAVHPESTPAKPARTRRKPRANAAPEARGET